MLQVPRLMIDDGPKRKRAVGLQQEAPAAKKPALDTPNTFSKAESEETRSIVRGLFVNYQALLPSVDRRSNTLPAAFKAVVQAAQGDVAGRRLAARLIPRFISQFPDQADVAAVALTDLHRRQSASDCAEVRHLEDVTRQDALNGLPAILQCAPCNSSVGERAVKHVLEYLFRLFPEAAAVTDEPSEPEEEGEVTNGNGTVANIHFFKKLLRHALQLHPTITLGYCFSCLSATNTNYSSNSASADPKLQLGVRLWLKDHLLRESTPSRETTPLGDGLLSTAAADNSNGTAKSAGKGCCLKAVLDRSQELQAWVMQQARGRATAPSEVRMVLETALQLLPPHAQLAAAKPRIDPPAAASRHQQYQRLASSGSLPNLRHQAQQQPVNAVGFINGMAPLSRTVSTPSSSDKQNSRGHSRTSGAAADAPYQQQQQQQVKQPSTPTLRCPSGFPQPTGPICRVEPCLLAFNLPRDVSRQSVQAALGADEVWIMEQQQHSSSSGCASACCTFKSVVDAAKAYLKHNGTARFGPGSPPLLLLFADSLPSSSSKRAAAAAEPSNFVWATRDAAGDAESITEDLRTAGLRLDHVHRVNNAAEPGTLLKTPSGQHAASVVKYLLKKHPQSHSKAATADAAGDQESLPPLPQEPPPSTAAGEWGAAAGAAGAGRQQAVQQQQGMPPLPPGPPPPWSQQQQQQHLERVSSAGSLVRPASPAVPPGAFQQQQQQPPGYADAAGANLKHRSPGNTWGSSPSEWQQQTLLGSSRDQHQSRWAPAAAGVPPSHAHHQQQQQQGGWHGRGQGTSSVPAPAPPPGPPPLPPGQASLGLGASPGAAGSSSWHTLSPGHTPQHGPGLIPPPAAPPGQPQLQQNLGGRGPLLHQQQPQQQRQGPSLTGGVAGPKPPPNPPWGSAAAAGPAGGAGYPPRGPPQGRVLWQGSIVKQSVRMCGVVCMISGGHGHQPTSGYASEPQHWPDQLHVNYRICVPDAVEQYMQAAPEHRAVRLLLPQSPDADTQQLQQFINYLNGKERAGMVKLPPVREQGLGPRSVYLIVPKPQLCQQLQVLWNERDVMLLAVVVPQHGSSSGATVGGMSGHRQQHRS